MNKGENYNHPKKGRVMVVEPIRSLADVRRISRYLEPQPRNHLLFVMGINNGLRAGDLLTLRVGQVRHLRAGDRLSIREGKTGKLNTLEINQIIRTSLDRYLDAEQPGDEDYLFRSKKGHNSPLTIQSVNALVKRWTAAINLPGNYGAHTLRKTFGYIQRTIFNVGYEVLARRFNHASPATTMVYLGIDRQEAGAICQHEIG